MPRITPIPAFNDNYIWCWIDEDSHRAAVVDPGDADPVLSFLKQHQMQLDTILVTHHHHDHTGGIERLLQEASPQFSIPVYGPSNSVIRSISEPMHEGESFLLFGRRVQVMTIPGHTLDHIGYFVAASATDQTPFVFCGDTLFRAGCGRLFEGTPEQMLQSLNRLNELPAETLVYCTHEYTLSNLAFAAAVEPHNQAIQEAIKADQHKRQQQLPTLPSTLAEERRINPFMRTEAPAVQAAAGNLEQIDTTNATEVFRVIRDWKNRF